MEKSRIDQVIMNANMKLVFAQEPIPMEITKSIFLAGPTPRAGAHDTLPSWRKQAMSILSMMGYNGVVFVPEPRSGSWDGLGYVEQVEWEERCLNVADKILFWIPRDMKTLPGLTTNDEWGYWKNSGKCVLGCPDDAQRVRYQKYYADKFDVPVFNNIYHALSHLCLELGDGELRRDGEVEVPLHIWKLEQFQSWYAALKGAGNRLESARVLWSFRPGGKVFSYVLHASVWVESEQRVKENEFVVSRPDVSCCVMYYHEPGSSIGDTQVLVIKEFRTPVANSEGMVVEVPGGSSIKPVFDPVLVMLEEVKEETGIDIDPSRVREIGAKQLQSTMLSHRAHVYAVELTPFEVDDVKSLAGNHFGNADNSEITYPQMRRLIDLVSGDSVDWSNIGMIFSALLS